MYCNTQDCQSPRECASDCPHRAFLGDMAAHLSFLSMSSTDGLSCFGWKTFRSFFSKIFCKILFVIAELAAAAFDHSAGMKISFED